MIPQIVDLAKELDNFIEEEGKFKPYKAFKGFNKDLKCRDVQFVVGEVFSKEFKEKPRLCSNDGFHYCDTLENVFSHYDKHNGNRFCEIEILNPPTKDHEKCVTTSFKILREIPQKEILESIYEENLRLNIIKDFQQEYPLSHVGGSAGLYLHGIQLERTLVDMSSDIDIVIPYYMIVNNDETEHVEEKFSHNDFDESVIYKGVKVDLKIDPKQKYEIIEYKGFQYKVSFVETIMEAKLRYAMQGNQKHKQDFYEIIGKKKKEIKNNEEQVDLFELI